MLTPYFEISQDNDSILLKIQVAKLRFNDNTLDLTVDGCLFIFYATPYYLRLRFNQNLLNEDDIAPIDPQTGEEYIQKRKVKYDADQELLVIELPKLNVGERFTDLDMVHKLMANSSEVITKTKISPEIKELKTTRNEDIDIKKEASGSGKLIEELDINDPSISTSQMKEYIEKYEQTNNKEFGWEIPQSVTPKDAQQRIFPYGFNDSYSNALPANTIFELANIASIEPIERIKTRNRVQSQKFSPEKYLQDLQLESEADYDSELLQEAMKWKNETTSTFVKFLKTKSDKPFPDVSYNKEVQQLMIDLPKKVKSYDIKNTNQIYYLIISLLYAYNHDIRINTGDISIESGYNIGRLVPQFSWLDNQITVRKESTGLNKMVLNLLISTLAARTCSFSYFSNFRLVKLALDDTYYALRSGKKKLIEIFFNIREIFRKNLTYSLFCDIYLNDLLNYLIISEDVTNNAIRKLSHEFHETIQTFSTDNIKFEIITYDDTNEIKVVQEDHLIALSSDMEKVPFMSLKTIEDKFKDTGEVEESMCLPKSLLESKYVFWGRYE